MGRAGGGEQTCVAEQELQTAPRCLRPGWFPLSSHGHFIYLFLSSCSASTARVERKEFSFYRPHESFLSVGFSSFSMCVCGFPLHILLIYRTCIVCVCVCVCLLLSLCVWKWKSRDSVRGEVERWCVSCHRAPLCLHVDLLDLQLTNLSAGLIFLPKGGT